jgi:hypothetical protein
MNGVYSLKKLWAVFWICYRGELIIFDPYEFDFGIGGFLHAIMKFLGTTVILQNLLVV